MQLTGAQIVIECLKEQGVDTVFGYPGGAILNVYDELYKHQGEIRHVLTSHEQGASHAADGYARSTGKVGVCFATSGPGATNLVTGIATAYMDSVPVVAITCNVTVPLLGKDSFQEIDIAGITMPITKHNFIVKDVTKLADTIRRAFKIAQTGRPGPVLVDIPKDITAAKTEYTSVEPKPIARVTDTICEKDVDTAVSMIKAAKKPYIFVGGGAVISGASEELKEFAGKVNAPVCDTLMGKGAFDGTDDLYTGMLGMHGTKTSNLSVSECDLLIAVGVRFSDRVLGNAKKFASQAKILQFDVDAAEINKNIQVDASVIGDLKEILIRVNEKLDAQSHPEWIGEIMDLKKKYPHSKLFYMFTNTLSSRVNEKQLRFVENNREKFDMIITFNEIDAVEHNFQFYNQVCSVLNVSIKEENESDIFFCGLDKGRRAIIEQLRNRLESCGIKCDFNIVDSKHKLPYEVIVSKIVQTKCILEILMDTSQSGSSLRAAEAIAYKKKLLTNNAFIKAKEYFNDKQFSYFSTLEDIDVDFIKEALDKSQCVDSMIVSPKRFLDFLKQNSI